MVLMVVGFFSGIYAVNTMKNNNQRVNINKINNTSSNGTKIIYVSKNGIDRNDGLTPRKTKRNIVKALNAVNHGDTIKVVPWIYQDNLLIDKNITLIGKHTKQHNSRRTGQ